MAVAPGGRHRRRGGCCSTTSSRTRPGGHCRTVSVTLDGPGLLVAADRGPGRARTRWSIAAVAPAPRARSATSPDVAEAARMRCPSGRDLGGTRRRGLASLTRAADLRVVTSSRDLGVLVLSACPSASLACPSDPRSHPWSSRARLRAKGPLRPLRSVSRQKRIGCRRPRAGVPVARARRQPPVETARGATDAAASQPSWRRALAAPFARRGRHRARGWGGAEHRRAALHVGHADPRDEHGRGGARRGDDGGEHRNRSGSRRLGLSTRSSPIAVHGAWRRTAATDGGGVVGAATAA